MTDPTPQTTPTRDEAVLPDRIWIERDADTDEKRWFSIPGMGVEYVRAAPSGEALEGAGRDVLAERRRQIEAEGWTAEHDDTHSEGQLALAAGCYATVAGLHNAARLTFVGRDRDGEQTPWPNWPWSSAWWKPKSRRSDLVRAGALILAEIERLDRKEAAR